MPSATSKYRFDLDGLRGIAIALVVVFHVYVGRVSGGVDVFLLLSGYFFLGALVRNAQKPEQSINPWWSIWRTLRRLAPGLLVVLAATTIAAFTLAPTLIEGRNAKQLFASILYYQNYQLARHGADYAAAADDTSPLQHLWSMSVQGQFYLAAILIISGLAWYLQRNLTTAASRLASILQWILLAITLASFGWAWHLHLTNQAFAYYSTGARLWELCLGGLLVLHQSRLTVSSTASRILAPLGLVMVISTGFFFDGGQLFPGPWALWPLLGAAFVIIAGGQPGFTTRVLSSPPMLFFGEIAYALYLWHWPLLIIATVFFNQAEPSFAVGTAVIVASLVLAWFTNRYVEKPLAQRRRRPRKDEDVVAEATALLKTSAASRRRAMAGIALATIAGSMLVLKPIHAYRVEVASASVLDKRDYPGMLEVTDGAHVPDVKRIQPNPSYIRDLWPQPAFDGCITLGLEEADKVITTKRLTDDSPCVYGDVNGDKTMVLVGGSHSEHWFSPLDAAAKEAGYRLVIILRQGCPPMMSPIEGVGDICIEWTHAVLDYLDTIDPDVVVATSSRPGSELTDYMPSGYQEFYQEVLARGPRVIGIRDTPWAYDTNGESFSPTKCLIHPRSTPTMPESDSSLHTPCDIPRVLVMSPENEADYVFADEPRALSLDFTDEFCDDQRCRAIIGNTYVYRDDNHISNEIAESLSKEMTRRLLPFLNEA
ncbi:acyltransferase family protein [Corynebacterium sp. H113]|uniref:acyltransferase family protein n=1 Tax=Corynebacterium sp. H113 TaxID=3133419 RepID=UPI0030B1FBC3